MKSKKSLILGSLLLAAVTLFAQDKKEMKAGMQMTAEQQKEQENWMKYMTPGEMQSMLAKANGNWHEELVFWMAPDAPPTKAESECTNSMIMGGRYQESIHTGNMMGMPFEGRSVIGFDNAKKVFQSTWVDNMGSGILFMEGPYDAQTKTITMTGRMVDPMTGKIERERQVMKFIDDRTQMLEMYATKNGKEFKSMEIKFTKK